ncbi:MAG: DNA recombination protein RmuC, partial [Limnohabitans sp.]|nr:DNA recombination protein RmuC [Limnohabitans sp.]
MSEMVWLALAGLNLALLVVLLLKSGAAKGDSAQEVAAQQAEKQAAQTAWQQQQFEAVQSQTERLERELRTEISQSGVQGRQEAMQTLTLFQQSLLQQSAEATRTQNQQIDALA